jgi:transcriptional regulator with XRE-family HTH domain
MSITETPTVPQWTEGDRLRKSREAAGLSQQQLADLIGISRRSIVNYEGGKHDPSRPVVLSWALATGVPLVWLSDGHDPHDDGPPTEASPHARRSNRVSTATRHLVAAA